MKVNYEGKTSFLGRGWSFPPTFSKDGVDMVAAEEDIEQSLHILLTTNLGERIMLPDYGSDLYAYLFEEISTSKTYFIQEVIAKAIINYEPRIELIDVTIDQTEYLDGIVRIKVNYCIRSTNTRFNLVFPFYKTEGTVIPNLYSKTVIQNSEEHS